MKEIDKIVRVQEMLTELVDSDKEYHGLLKKVALKNPWRPRPNFIQNFRDQFLHMIYGAALILPIAIMESTEGAFTTGLIVGLTREIEQYFNQDLRIRMLVDRVIDVLFFGFGAAVAFWLVN